MKGARLIAAVTVCCFATVQSIEPAIADQPVAEALHLNERDEDALELGRKVIKARAALANPDKEGSIGAIKALGLDSRYDVMTRGWIQQHISMTESYRNTASYRDSDQRKNEVEGRISALKKMIRAIDLE
jgi:hypothetical protein